jgi:CBS domain-containing protein
MQEEFNWFSFFLTHTLVKSDNKRQLNAHGFAGRTHEAECRENIMAGNKTVRDLMVDVFEYPHMPYWFTIRQAVGIMRKTVIDAQKCIHPQVILVFDEKYTLIGTLNMRNILQGLTPGPSMPDRASAADDAALDENAFAVLEASLFGDELKKLSDKPISEVMEPITVSAFHDDPVVKAVFLMESRNLQVLPVLENNKKLVGIVRLMEVFQEISNRLLEK